MKHTITIKKISRARLGNKDTYDRVQELLVTAALDIMGEMMDPFSPALRVTREEYPYSDVSE